jgi:hypothetical protein
MFKWLFKKKEEKSVSTMYKVKNLLKEWNEDDEYYVAKLALEDGDEFFIMLTDNDLQEAKERASRNLEDIPLDI